MSVGSTQRAGRSPQVNQSSLEIAKWAAIVAMTVDHANKLLTPGWFDLSAYMLGRMAFPLFAWIVAVRLAMAPELALRYLPRLAFWAAVSQPIYVWGFGEPWHHLNILVTLALGVAAAECVRRGRAWWLGAAVAVAAGALADYGPVGVAMVPLLAALARRDAFPAALACGPLAWLANDNGTGELMLANAACLGASLIALASLRPLALPRLPGMAFYAFYPAHILMLGLLGR